jgi:uncharacterized membrane protein
VTVTDKLLITRIVLNVIVLGILAGALFWSCK